MKIIRTHAKPRLREALFSWDITPDLTDFVPKAGETLIVQIEETINYKNQRRKVISSSDNTRLKKLRENIRKGFITIDKLSDENTHILTGGGKGKNLESLLVSKDVNRIDRLTYRIYKINHITQEEIDSSGNKVVTKIAYQKIVLEACKGHMANGQGDYMKDPKVREQFNRKRHRDSNRGRNTTN